MLDIFNNDAFGVVALTARINRDPFVPGQIGQAGYFQEAGVDTLTIAVERTADQKLRLVGPTPRGGPGETRTFDDGSMLDFRIPHFQREDSMLADEVQGRRTLGAVGAGTDQTETLVDRMAMRMGVHLRDFDLTIEHQRVGAIKGIVVSKTGGVMYNFYNAFEISVPTPISLDLDNPDKNLYALGRDIRYRFEDDIDGPYDGIDCWMGREAFDLFVMHKYNTEAYRVLQDRSGVLGVGSIDEVDMYGINWKRYRTGAKATAANGGAAYIGPREIRFVPRGIDSMFLTRFGPADYMETVNTIGLPRYMKQFPRLDDKGVEVQVQTNPINFCTRPDLLIAGTIE